MSGDLPGVLWEVFEHDPIPSFVVDADGNIVAGNRSAEGLTGTIPVGSSFTELMDVHRPQRELLSDRVTKAARGHAFRTRAFIDTKGHKGIAEISASGTTLDGRPSVLLRIFTGKAMSVSGGDEGDMDRTLAHAETILTNLPLGLLVLDEEGVIVFENERLKIMMGIPDDWPSAVIGRRLAEMPNVQDTRLAPVVEDMLDGEPFGPIQVPFRSLAGRETVIVVHGAPITGKDGGNKGGVVLVEDVTDRVELEHRLSEARRLEVVGRMAAGVAHDFNNLLGSMRAAAEALPDLAAEQRGRLIDITERGGALTGRLLAFLRPHPTEHRIFDARRVINDAAHLLERTLGPRYSIDIDITDAPVAVQGEPALLTQVLLNLGHNARDAMPAGGSVQIGIEVCDGDHGGPFAGKTHAMFWVRDYGPGVPDEELDHIFDLFVTSKPAGIGTGMGLNIARDIIHAHGGLIAASNHEDGGLVVRMCLPLPDSAIELPEPERRPPSLFPVNGAGRKVLLVEDEHDLGASLQALLQRAGWTVRWAQTGMQAIEAINRGFEPDAAVVDMMLPDDLTGAELLDALRELIDLPAVVVSGFVDEDTLHDVMRRRNIVFLNKPFPINRLVNELGNLVDRDGD